MHRGTLRQYTVSQSGPDTSTQACMHGSVSRECFRCFERMSNPPPTSNQPPAPCHHSVAVPLAWPLWTYATQALPCPVCSAACPPPPRCPPADVHTMVLATELAGIAGAAYTGWQVLGAWLRYVRQMGVRFDDVSLLEAVDIFFAGLITKGEDAGGRKEGWGWARWGEQGRGEGGGK